MNKFVKNTIAATCAAAAAAGFLAFENNALTVSRLKIVSGKIRKGEGLRIVLISDLQSKSFGKKQHRLVKGISALMPDVILFAGDMPDRNHTDFGPCRELIRGLSHVAPVCYVNGNHELSLDDADIGDMYEYMEKVGWRVLLDKGCAVSVMSKTAPGTSYKICVAGISEDTVSESRGGDRSNPSHDGRVITEAGRRAVTESHEAAGRDENFTVLLVHEPQFISDYEKCGADLIASGHAHGGQIRIPAAGIGLYAPEQGILPRYTSGLYDASGCSMVVSRGLGNSTFPFRVFNRPEIVVIDAEGI